MPANTQAVVEYLDPLRVPTLSELDLPTFDRWLTWKIRRIDQHFPLCTANIVFVIGTASQKSILGDRVGQYRKAHRIAIGACVDREESPTRPAPGVLRLSPLRWRRELRLFLTSVASMLGEGQPEAFVCIDWADVVEALNATPGELLMAWSMRDNADAFKLAFEKLRRRLAGRPCRSIVCLFSGGPHPWFKELRTAVKACRALLAPDGVILGGDRVAPFDGKPGCCLLAVASASD